MPQRQKPSRLWWCIKPAGSDAERDYQMIRVSLTILTIVAEKWIFAPPHYRKGLKMKSHKSIRDEKPGENTFRQFDHPQQVAKEHVMAVGWSRDGAVQDQIDATVEDGVQRARSRLPDGESSAHCQECGAIIPEARRRAIPGVCLCVGCQSEHEKEQTTFTLFNRRGSKDSQLK